MLVCKKAGRSFGMQLELRFISLTRDLDDCFVGTAYAVTTPVRTDTLPVSLTTP